MNTSQRGFTLIELMIVVVIIGVLAAIAIPNFIAMQARAKEGSTKANMHTFQLTAEDYGIQADGIYSATADAVVNLMPAGGTRMVNPFDQGVGSGAAWEDRASYVGAMTARPGMVSYADSGLTNYLIKGYGKAAEFSLQLTAGQ